MNPLLARAIGESTIPPYTGDVMPVIANRTRAQYRDRMQRPPVRKGGRHESLMRRALGEAAPDETDAEAAKAERVIPDDAQELDDAEVSLGKPLAKPKEVVQEPSHPNTEKEKYLTPYSALTAPDATPQANQPIDPSRVPGAAGPQRFTGAELAAAPEIGERNKNGTDINPLDLLLGRRGATPTIGGPDVPTNEEQAAAMLGIKTPLQESAAGLAASALVPGSPMPPPPVPSDGKPVYEAFRRFSGK